MTPRSRHSLQPRCETQLHSLLLLVSLGRDSIDGILLDRKIENKMQLGIRVILLELRQRMILWCRGGSHDRPTFTILFTVNDYFSLENTPIQLPANC